MRKLLIIFLLLLVVLPLTSAVEIEFVKESDIFDQGETLISIVSGNFVDQITRDNILFFHDHVRVPMIYEVKKINQDFYIYAVLLDKSEGNYSFVVRDVRYWKDLQITEEDIVKNFTITKNTADFYVRPGFVITQKDFFLDVQNLKEKRITINVETPKEFNIEESFFELSSGQIKKINFIINTEQNVFEKIKLISENTSYTVPIFFEVLDDVEEEDKEKVLDFKFEPNVVSVSMPTNSDSKRIIYLVNTGEDTIEDISFLIQENLENYVTISPKGINALKKDSAEKIEILIVSGEEEKNLEGIITVSSGNLTTYFTLILDFVIDFIPDEEPEHEIITTCAQLGGLICREGEKCTGKTTPARDGVCCLPPSTCEKPKESPTGKIIGWAIVIFVLILLFWFFRKYKKARPKADFLDIGKGKGKK